MKLSMKRARARWPELTLYAVALLLLAMSALLRSSGHRSWASLSVVVAALVVVVTGAVSIILGRTDGGKGRR